jgi:hypothetical protein
VEDTWRQDRKVTRFGGGLEVTAMGMLDTRFIVDRTPTVSAVGVRRGATAVDACRCPHPETMAAASSFSARERNRREVGKSPLRRTLIM